jgi:hypothetical protein
LGLLGENLGISSSLSSKFGAPGGIRIYTPLFLEGAGQLSRVHNRLIRRYGIPPIIVAGMLGHSLAILMTTYAHLAHLARFARYAPCDRNIPGTQDEAARLMDEILTPIPIDLDSLKSTS